MLRNNIAGFVRPTSPSFWVAKKAVTPSPDQYYSIIFPNPDTGYAQRYIPGFKYKHHARSSLPKQEVSLIKMSLNDLKKATFSGVGVVGFKDDLTYMDPCVIIPPNQSVTDSNFRDSLENSWLIKQNM